MDWNRAAATQFVAASGWGDLRVYDIRKGDLQAANTCLLSFKGLDSNEVTGCAWSRDGRRLVGSWQGGKAYTFHVEDAFAWPAVTGDAALPAHSPVLAQLASARPQSDRCCAPSRPHAACSRPARELEDFYFEIGRQRFINRLLLARIHTAP